MIPDVLGEPEPVDFSWFFFIGRAKLNLTTKEVGRLTFRMFGKLYKHYKDTFDIEMLLSKEGKTYAEIDSSNIQNELWL